MEKKWRGTAGAPRLAHHEDYVLLRDKSIPRLGPVTDATSSGGRMEDDGILVPTSEPPDFAHQPICTFQLIPFAERQVKEQHHVEMTTTSEHDHNANQGNADEDLKIVKVVKKLQDGE